MQRTALRRSGALALLFALIVPLLVACGGTPAAGTNPTTAAPAAEASATPAAADSTSAPEATTAAEPTTEAEPAAEPTAAADTGASTSGAPTDNVIRIHQPAWPDSLDPQKASNASEIDILQLNYEGLTKLDKDLKTVAGAAESWTYNDDSTEVTFKLREGLKYSDGSPLPAQEFVNALYRVLDPRAPGNYQTLFDMVQGADKVIGASPDDAAALTELFKQVGASAPDDTTVVFKLSRPTPFFHTLVSTWAIYPAKQALVEAGGEQWYEVAENHLGNGPFQITTLDRGANLIELKANENYWEGRPKLDGVQLKIIEDLAVAFEAYKSGEIDIIIPDPNNIPTIKADPALLAEYKEYPGSCTEIYEINQTIPPFDNKAVREAFALGFDRASYIRDALKDTSVETLTWIPPGYPGHDPAVGVEYAYDPEKAKAKLAEAGFPDGQGLPEVKISYNSSNSANQARVEYLIQMYQKSMGVTLVPDPVEATTLVNLRKDVATHPQMNAGGWCADYPDPQNWLSVYWHSSSQFAATVGYKNAEVDALIEQADVESDEAKRMQLYADAQKLVIADGQLIRSNNKNYFLIKPYIKGLEFTPQDSIFPGQQTGLFNVTIEP
jgi:oligopeptide transport system substrate-binding protein